MLDLKNIRVNSQEVIDKLQKRNGNYEIKPILDLDSQQRELQSQVTDLQARSNEIGKLIGQKIRNGANPQGEDIKTLKEEGKEVKNK